MKLMQKFKRARSDRERLLAKAEHATVYIVRDGRGRVVGAR